MFILFSAILITGGGGSRLNSAEIYRPSDNTSCTLPELPKGRSDHSQDGPWACGGGDYNSTRRTCDKWSEGNWTRQSFSLMERRFGHVSWATGSGLYLIGGLYGGNTSELVKENSTVEVILTMATPLPFAPFIAV